MDVFDDFQVTRLPKFKGARDDHTSTVRSDSTRAYSSSSTGKPYSPYSGSSGTGRYGSAGGKSGAHDDEYDRILDHMWYDRDDESLLVQNDFDEESASYLAQKEASKLSRLPGTHSSIGSQKNGPKSSLSLQKHIDTNLWELNRIKRGGGGGKLASLELQQLNASNVHKDETKRIVLVRNVIPPFVYEGTDYAQNLASNLENYTFNDIYTKFLTQVVSVFKDPTSDISNMAKRGSELLRKMKEEAERTATRVRFWDLEGSKLGHLLRLEDIKTSGDADTDAGQHEDDKSEIVDGNDEDEAKDLEAIKKSLKSVRESLPVYKCRTEFLELVNQFQALVVVGETGSGKTTQIPQFLYEAGYGKAGTIGITQPRRVAAVSVCQRVAQEIGSSVGDLVGYSIRFEDVTGRTTRIKFMTDGILLRETLMDPDLDKYSCIVMDEAHERSLNTDVLFGILKQVLARRRDIRVIVTSATMDAEKFSKFFGVCPTFHIPGRVYPVRMEYLRGMGHDYIEAAVEKCVSIHISQGPGDVLIFMTGQDDINATCQLLDSRLYQVIESSPNASIDAFVILPIYSQLPHQLQQRVFRKYSHRKIIVSTNIAETSLTFEGIKYVIDSGFCKVKVYNPRVGMDSLQVVPTSQAGANQRAGRAGRTQPGVCYRLYTERTFINDMFENNVPEIKRTNLCNVVLMLKSLNVNKVTEFDFIDAPTSESITSAMLQLWILGALDELGNTTDVGKQLVHYPLEPPLGKMLVFATGEGCISEILTIVSILSAPNIYLPEVNVEKDDMQTESIRDKYIVQESDHLTMLNIYKHWQSNNESQQWCNSLRLSPKSLQRAKEIRMQLAELVRRQGYEESSCGTNWDSARRAICAGYLSNVAKLKGLGEYSNLRSFAPCFMHPTSALYGMGYTPDYLVYHEVVITAKEYMRYVTAVDAEWLQEMGSDYFYIKQVDANNEGVADALQASRDKLENRRLLGIKRLAEENSLEAKNKVKDANQTAVTFGARKRQSRF